MDQKQKNAHGAGQVSRERPTRPHGTPRYTVVPVIHPVGTREKKNKTPCVGFLLVLVSLDFLLSGSVYG